MLTWCKMKRGPENENARALIVKLEKSARKNDAPIWRSVAERMSSPRRKRAIVNLYEIDRHAGDAVIVPGKMLGIGSLKRSVRIAALVFSKSARQKVEAAGGACMSIEQLLEENPKGSGVAIIA